MTSMDSRRHLTGWLGALVLAVLAGCDHAPPPAPSQEPPVVPVSHPVSREVTDYVDYTGRTAAVNAVDIRARVTGYLVKMPFREGAEVKQGELLFEIDPRPYQAQLDAVKAQVALAEANYRFAQAEYARSRAIAARERGAISREDLERYQAQELQGQAQLGVARANLTSAQLNVEYTRITAPLNGQISRYYYTVGNLVNADQTLLTTLVSIDPMYAYFDMDERTILRIRTAINEGRIKPPKDTNAIPLLMGLEGEEGYPHHGTISFINNVVNPSTGTLTVRGVFDNPKPAEGRRLITPGMFVRIRLPIGQPHSALLVIDRAIGSDQGLKFVYVLDAENKVQYRRVSTGPLQEDGLRVIQGVEQGDWVVVGALPQIRPHMQIEPERIPMPTLETPGGSQAPSPVPARPQPPPPGRTDR